MINLIKTRSNKSHFITKVTGDLRKNVFDNIFDQFEILWIERDPRVVVSSYIKQQWFYKDKPLEYKKLSKKDKIEFYSSYYMRVFNNSKSVKRKLVFYEDLCDNPEKFMRNLLKDFGLDFSEYHASQVKNRQIRKIGWSHYKSKYTNDEIKLINKLLQEPLTYYKYT
ncbi:sulfotransferase [Psychroflexus salis]|uniref:Sulfotransferase domain-containing protein n=1 Tax=Psychroflexus salis TaxID=1526574 RepID=A0A916ZRM1_9FLAO|nr:sulfotransferase [Psychroflexus salis]GGE10535.1 hypothetical protein GCM10010831_10070 [Psychroflexus salis]